jgi:polyhydroxyalkanoate synthesis regulator phasin
MVSRAQDSVRSQFNTGAVNSGSFGNSGLQEQFQRGLSDTASSLFGQAYETDRARQMQGIGMAQQFGNQAYTDADQMLKAGQIQQDQGQQNLDFDYQQFQEKENLPYKQLAAMSGVFSSGLGSQTTSKTSGGGK